MPQARLAMILDQLYQSNSDGAVSAIFLDVRAYNQYIYELKFTIVLRNENLEGEQVELSGGEILVRCLEDEGVEFLFGYPGGAVLHIYDALYQQDAVKHILVRHEQAATHAADGYARATGKPGVVLVTSGPGATNAVTGIATAHMDSIPMVVITGQVPSAVIK